VPWCTACDRFLSPSSVNVDGTCSRCGAVVDPGRAHAPSAPRAAESTVDVEPPATAAGHDAVGSDDEADTLPLPWHFKLLVGAIALYLGWRAVQGVEWVVHRF
jgi:hypothetical protein